MLGKLYTTRVAENNNVNNVVTSVVLSKSTRSEERKSLADITNDRLHANGSQDVKPSVLDTGIGLNKFLPENHFRDRTQMNSAYVFQRRSFKLFVFFASILRYVSDANM